MAEPTTTAALALAGLGWIGTTIAGGIAGNASDRVFCKNLCDVKARVAGLRSAPENHDVARAVRTAQVQALERVIRDYEEINTPEWTDERHLSPFFKRSLAFCRKTVGRRLDPRIKLNFEVSQNLTDAIDNILAPPVHDGPAGERSQALASLAEQAVLDELQSVLGHVRLPDGFEAHFREGASDRLRFLDLFGAYILEQLKKNGPFRRLFTTGQLLRIQTQFGDTLRRIEATADKISATQDAHGAMLAELLARSKGISPEILKAILAKLGEANVPDDQIAARLEAKADEFLTLREQWSKVQNQHPNVVAVRQDAFKKMDAGDLDAARALLAKVRGHIRELRQELSRQEAVLLADEAAIAQLQLHYYEAADKLAEAAQLVEFDGEAVLDYRGKEAEALYHQGDEFGDNDALVKLIDVLEALEESFGEQMPPKWSEETRRHLSVARYMLGERKSDRPLLEKAEEGFRLLLENPIADREPLQQVCILIGLNSVRLKLGELEGGTAQQEKALRAALDELQPNRVALLGAGGWIMAANHLGTVAAECGERDSGPRGIGLLEGAVQAFRSALDLRGTGWLEGAVQAFPSALDQQILKQVPRNWGTIQMNLGNALSSLGARDKGPKGTERLEDAVKTLRAALKEQPRKRLPLDWAMTKCNLGLALFRLGERDGGPEGIERLNKAVEAYKAALEEFTPKLLLWRAATQTNLGVTLFTLGARIKDRAKLEEAREAVSSAFAVYMQEGQEHRRIHFEAFLSNIDEALARLPPPP